MLKMLYINYFNIYNIMSYNVNGQNMLNWFYSRSQPSNSPNTASTTNFRINNVDISNNYNGLGTNSKIPVSRLYTLNYFSNGQSLGSLFELNLPVFSGTINVDYKIWPPNGISGLQTNNGLLIQFFKSTTFKFNYKVTCTFVMVGGGGGGGNSSNSNAGGGGGGGGLLRGKIVNYDPNVEGVFNIIIGNGGSATNSGGTTRISTNNYLISINGGGEGGDGKESSSSTTRSSSGGAGSFSNRGTSPGTVNNPSVTDVGIFQSMTAFANIGSRGGEQNNDSGGGGGGGGAGGASTFAGNSVASSGGSGLRVTFISASGVSSGTSVDLAGGGGGGARSEGNTTPGGSSGGGASGGQNNSDNKNGGNGTPNTGGGGGGAANIGGSGGTGGSGTLFLYVTPDGVSL